MAKKQIIPVKPNTNLPDGLQFMLPVGGGFDLPTGRWVELEDGTSIILGGLSKYWAISGPANSYKSALLLYFQQAAIENVMHIAPPSVITYDSENTYDLYRLTQFQKKFKYQNERAFTYSGAWSILFKREMFFDKAWNIIKDWFKGIIKANINIESPMSDPMTGKKGTDLFPSFLAIDSMSQVESEETNKATGDKDIGDKKAKTYYMNMGFDKSRVIGALGNMAQKAGCYVLTASHLGEKIAMAMNEMPKRELTDMPIGTILKGVPDNFKYLMLHIWMSSTATVPHVDGAIKYPKTQKFKDTPKGDLQRVRLTLVRSKTSPDGYVQNCLISKKEGYQPHLTCLIELKEVYASFGIIGNNTTYALAIYPSVKIMRTTARERIDNDAKLRRAIDITFEMAQTFALFLYDDPELKCTPEQLYEELDKMGYDWNLILSLRGNWVFNEDTHPIPRVSTMDLLNIRIGKLDLPHCKKPDQKVK